MNVYLFYVLFVGLGLCLESWSWFGSGSWRCWSWLQGCHLHPRYHHQPLSQAPRVLMVVFQLKLSLSNSASVFGQLLEIRATGFLWVNIFRALKKTRSSDHNQRKSLSGLIFSSSLPTWEQNGERVVRCSPPMNLFLLLGVFIYVPILVKIYQEMWSWVHRKPSLADVCSKCWYCVPPEDQHSRFCTSWPWPLISWPQNMWDSRTCWGPCLCQVWWS